MHLIIQSSITHLSPNTHMQYSNCTDLYSVTDCFLHVLDFCDWATLVAISHTNQGARDNVHRVFREKLTRVVSRLLENWQFRAIFRQLDVTGAMIVGPIPWSVMTIDVDTPDHNLPNDINIVTPIYTFQSWVNLLQYIGYCLVDGSNLPNMGITIGNAKRFWSPSQSSSILIIESCSPSILSPVLSLPFTSEMSLISTSRLYCFYPSLVKENMTLSGFRYTSDDEIARWTSRGVKHFYSTYEWKKACGSACPAIWRCTEGLLGVGEFAWGGMENDKDIDGNMGSSAVLSLTQFKWRIGICCVNKHCQFRTQFL
ncbi:hypothetical protein Hypma_014208 [Hypsizygus marmoreus]|uniref:Uncharacterized protein n=1 Tax=Hypsizygus marmoreus TaxID=39966 RepID=A0A369JHI2_HYPMA|nr:hypothetical protein Hypma_014208 [Hypsizygus marmoreus]